jgi:hypothetical protein
MDFRRDGFATFLLVKVRVCLSGCALKDIAEYDRQEDKTLRLSLVSYARESVACIPERFTEGLVKSFVNFKLKNRITNWGIEL